MKKLIGTLLLSTSCGLGGAALFNWIQTNPETQTINSDDRVEAQTVSYQATQAMGGNADFVHASKKSTACVVFIKTVSNAPQSNYWNDWFNFDMFGRRGKVSSSGSGVILSTDGYIVTNNHVVDGAESIEVILNNNRYQYTATIVGTDPSTDLALLKIDAKDLPAIEIGNSEKVEIGEWVLAVGNPFNLTSTVTAGIVSAKGRNINVVNNSFPIESFIQTDAAINPGNSGGALVNLNGELVGINTAIASNTGAYNGYGFAIPVNIVSKIIKDLKEHGEVQRAFTGMEVVDITAEILEKTGNVENGVYVGFVGKNSPADKAGLKVGDVILKVNGQEVNSKAMFDEQIAYYRPGEKVDFTLNNSKSKSLTLVNREGTTEMLKRKLVHSNTLGADFEKISKVEKDRFQVENGIRVSNINGNVLRRMNIPEGFIFVKINNVTFNDEEKLIKTIEQMRGRIVVEGIHPNGTKQVLSYYYY
ncbi:MAG: trypsin-like serine protease [Bacteroidetes bacterium]|nr:MAG: trypsin-like serine protease [Bacteroidota bacterium]